MRDAIVDQWVTVAPEVSQVQITDSCKLEVTQYLAGTYCELSYVEHSQDHWHSDQETTVDIDKEKAIALIELLNKFVEMVKGDAS